MKVIGFLSVCAAAILFSIQTIERKKRQADALRSFCCFLEQLYGALESDGSPMTELLEALCGRSGGDAEDFLKSLTISMDMLGICSFQTLWIKALHTASGNLDSDSWADLEALGGVLGRYELSVQRAAIDACMKNLRVRFEQVKSELPQSRRLTTGLALSAAALLGILLM